MVYLGEHEGAQYLGVVEDAPEVSDEVEPDPGTATLREVGAHVDDLGAALFAATLALANWHRVHGFCPRCGSRTEPVQAGWVRRCVTDGSEHYPRTDAAVIMAVVDDDDRLLLARGRGFRTRGMSVLAGFVEPGETLAGAVAREVAEEVGVEVDDVRYLGDQPWPFPSSLMVGFTAHARGTDLRLQEDEIAAARWFTVRSSRRPSPTARSRCRAGCPSPGASSSTGTAARSRRRRSPRCAEPSAQPRRLRTSASEGLVAAVPSGKRTVGTVWLPPLTSMTKSAASGLRSMSTSVNSMPSRSIWDFRRRQ